MTVAGILRGAAVGIAITAFADPACTRQVEVPLAILVRSGSGGAPDQALADRIRQRLASALPDRVDVDSPEVPDAIVVTGDIADVETLPADIPVSIVTQADGSAPNVRVAGLSSAPVIIAGWTVTILATVTASRAADETSVIVLEHNGIELDRVEHRWTADSEEFEARFAHVPPAAGVRAMRIAARPLETGEATVADNHADLRLMVEERKLRVLVHEPRPSWGATFIRRVLEDEPLFETAGLSRPSRGVEIRAGAAPDRLRSDRLDSFDLVVVGAPEELRQDEIDALERFARVRGGTIVLVPDRRPSGAYLELIPAASFEERLLEGPAAIVGSGPSLRGTEFAVPVRPAPAVDVAASLEGPVRDEPVVIAWPMGAGRGIYSGALDAWRHRARADEFAAFWRAQIASSASASPRRVEAALDPGVASPGQPVTLQVGVRATEFASRQPSIDLPTVSASLTHPDGSSQPIRLWPEPEPGLFAGRFQAPAEGTYSIQASAGAGVTFHTTLIVSASARTAGPDAPESLGLLSRATGGVTATADDLSGVAAHLTGLPLRSVDRPTHPTRSTWWMAAFVLLLCAEWGIRRRGGLS